VATLFYDTTITREGAIEILKTGFEADNRKFADAFFKHILRKSTGFVICGLTLRQGTFKELQKV